jgi:hypothetical protein
MLLGCTGQSDGASSSAAASGEAPDPDAPTPDDPGEQPPSPPPSAALLRGLGHEATITEVWLDARASAALTLDREGGVRLWPALPPAQTKLDALAPIRVPVLEPAWLSFARVGEREFLLATIDTAQATRVMSITLDDAGQARVRDRFAIPPSDPLLELHVLESGTRLLALGVDHRIRLYDADGKLLAELREHGLIPWQLRLAGPPEATKFAMVLAGPTRLQRFEITGDQLRKLGEPRPVVLDRGPNGNDLALLPAGKAAVVLRRPKAKGPQWSIEVHDLDSGEVRVLWGEIEGKWRPRMHVLDDTHVLLEDGIAGYTVDLSKAVAMPAPFELPKQLEKLPAESHVTVEKLPLPGTTRETRRNASVVAGVRVIPRERGFVLDPINDARHFELGHRGIAVGDLALDEGGKLLAAIYAEQVIVETLATGTAQAATCAPEKPTLVRFTDADHLLLVGASEARICAWASSKVVATLELPAHERVHVRTLGDGAAEWAFELPWDEAGELALSHVKVEANAFGPITPLTKQEFERWPEFGPPYDIIDAVGNRFRVSPYITRHVNVALAAGGSHEIKFTDRRMDPQQFVPSDGGQAFALLSRPVADGYGYGYGYGYGGGAVEPNVLELWSVAGDKPQQRMQTSTDDNELALAWTRDGSRIAMVDDGRLRVMTIDGELLLDRGVRELHLDELPDVAPAKPEPPKP